MDNYIKRMSTASEATDWKYLEILKEELRRVKQSGNTLFVAGNGGSFAVAMHWGVDFPKFTRLKTHTLGMNPALFTALSNDIGYETAFAEELSQLAVPGDVFVALSCSGRSPNIVGALGVGKLCNIPIYMITGALAPVFTNITTIRVFSEDYGVLEDIFSAIGHWLSQELIK